MVFLQRGDGDLMILQVLQQSFFVALRPFVRRKFGDLADKES
jgi:hypothetical protein